MMPEPQAARPPSTGLKRWLMRAPIWLYRMRLGWLLGNRFLLLNHKGRHSRRWRQAVLEVAGQDPEAGTYTVAAGFGPRSDWYRNLSDSIGEGQATWQNVTLPEIGVSITVVGAPQ